MNTKKAFQTEAWRAKQRLEPQVRTILDNSGWPKEVTSQLSLVSTRDAIGIYIPANLAQQVEDLEYGTVGTPPSWVMRRIDELVDQVLEDEVQKEYVNFIFSEDVLL